jgi:uncharacterized phage protein (TIGR01671 family)
MNREIKFRAWHKDLKKMFKIGQITLEEGTWNFEPNDRGFIGMSIPYQPSFVLMQYTGLHDKNGTMAKRCFSRRARIYNLSTCSKNIHYL